MRIGDIAKICRCQIHRERLKEKTASGKLYEITAEDLNRGSLGGIARFVPQDPRILLNTDIDHRFMDFALQEGDILIPAVGGLNTIGEAGLVAFEPAYAGIPSKNLILVRADPNKCDAVWLFYMLSRENMRNELKKRATGNRTSCLTNDKVASLEINKPDARDLQAVHDLHAFFLKNARTAQERLEMEKERWSSFLKNYA